MTFRELTELQEQSRNAAHPSAIMHSGNEWLEPTGSQPEMDRGRRRIAARDGLRPEMDDKRWIPSGDGSWPKWIATGYGWMTGDGSQEMDHGRRMPINLLPFYEDIEVMRSFTLLEITTLISYYATTQLQWNADMQTYDVPAAWLHRALFRALFRDTELNTYMPESQCRI